MNNTIFGYGIIPLMGLIFYFVLNSLVDILDLGSSFSDKQIGQIAGVYVSFNLALVSLIPVVSNQLQAKIGKDAKKIIYRIELDSISDSVCNGLFVWCAILLFCSILLLVKESRSFFLIVSGFELAVLVIWVIWFVVTSKRSWAKTYIEHIPKK